MRREMVFAAVTAAIIAGAAAGGAHGQSWRPPVAVFDGKTSVNFPADPSLELSGYGTIEFWVAPRWSTPPDDDPVILSYLGESGPLYTVVMTADRQAIGLMSGSDWDLTQFDFTDGKLHHVALVVMGEATEVYIDGKHNDTLMIGFSQGVGRSFHIGSLDGVFSPFKGGLAGLRIWNTTVSEADIDAYKMVDIFSREGRKHTDFDALVGASDFANGAMKVNLTQAFAPRANETANVPATAPASAPDSKD